MSHPNPIHRALWRPVLWMGTERITGALWVLLIILLVLMGLMLAGVWIVTTLIVAGGGAGFVWLTKLAEMDPQMTRVFLRRTLRYRGIYPACRTRIASHGRETRRGSAAGPGASVRDILRAGQRGVALKAKLKMMGDALRTRLRIRRPDAVRDKTSAANADKSNNKILKRTRQWLKRFTS